MKYALIMLLNLNDGHFAMDVTLMADRDECTAKAAKFDGHGGNWICSTVEQARADAERYNCVSTGGRNYMCEVK